MVKSIRYFTFTTNKFHILFDNEKYCITSFSISHQTFLQRICTCIETRKEQLSRKNQEMRQSVQTPYFFINKHLSIFYGRHRDRKSIGKRKKNKEKFTHSIHYTRSWYRCVQSFTVDMDSRGRKEVTRRIRIYIYIYKTRCNTGQQNRRVTDMLRTMTDRFTRQMEQGQ